MLRLKLWLQSRFLHEALSSFARAEGAQQEQYPKLSVLSPACECQLQRKLVRSLLITSILLQLLLCSCTFKVKVLASKRTAAYGIPLHRVLLAKAQPPGPFPAPNPMEENLCDHLSPYRQQFWLQCWMHHCQILEKADFCPLWGEEAGGWKMLVKATHLSVQDKAAKRRWWKTWAFDSPCLC